ncbi:hypothetical protein ACFWXB_03490 [Tsukamurella tyrosinosolvens]|uniref:phage holin family protein n=1 Tax=Tsukamurella tyrosinosolvens TaxID=57704 RepID=UPI0036BC2B5D
MASPSDPPTDRAGDTEQFPVTRVSTAAAATDTDDVPSTGGPAHAVTAGTPGISRAGWWAITIAAAVLLVLGFLLTFGPARYWTPVPVVFLGYFLLSGVTGLVFWKGVRELRDSNPTLHSGDGPATPGARVAAAIGAVGVASALVLLPAGLSDAPANAAPCPDGSNTCGPQPTMGPQPTQGNGGNTTAPQAPNTTVPGYTPPDTPPQQGNGSTPTVQGQVPTMPTGDSPSNGCILNCGPTQAPQAPQTGQATPPQTAQNPVTTAPNTPATTPQAPTTTPRLRTPTPETTTSTTSSKARDRDDDQQRSSDEDRDKNSPHPYQAAMLSAVGGTYRRKKTADAGKAAGMTPGRVVSKQISDQPVGDTYGREPYPPESEADLAAANEAFGKAAGDPPNESPRQKELKGIARRLSVEMNAGLMTGFLTPALQGLKHYLSPNSGDFVIWTKDMDKIIETEAYQKQIHQQLLGPMAYSIAKDGELKPGQSVTKYFKTPWEVSNGSALSEGHYNLLGNYSHMAMGRMTVTATANGYVYDASYAVSIYDLYDFNAKLSPPNVVGVQGISNADLVDLIGAGYAQAFRTVGTSGVHTLSGSVGTIGVPL